MQGPHIQIIVDRDPVPLPLQAALNRLGARVSIRSLCKAADAGVSPTADVCVILFRQDQPTDLLERVMSHAAEQACGTMMIPRQSTNSASVSVQSPRPTDRLASPKPEHADALNADEIIGRIKALCDIRQPMRHMRDELNRLKQDRPRTTADVRNLDEQLRLAGQIQNDLLPASLPDTAPLKVSTLYLPADYVSGDIYDIAALDETRVSFSIADVTGHGLPAALLTFLIKQSFRGKEIFNKTYRIIEPDEVLGRLNDDLMNVRLSECQFVTALHAVFDRVTGQIRWARGGSPYPILIRSGEPARLVTSEGGLIGAFPQRYEVVTHHLRPGDTLVFHTDGVDALVLNRRKDAGTSAILRSEWVRLLEADGPDAALQSLRDLASRSTPGDWPTDDITAIALQMD